MRSRSETIEDEIRSTSSRRSVRCTMRVDLASFSTLSRSRTRATESSWENRDMNSTDLRDGSLPSAVPPMLMNAIRAPASSRMASCRQSDSSQAIRPRNRTHHRPPCAMHPPS